MLPSYSKPFSSSFFFFFFNDTATTEIYTLSLHDALPIWLGRRSERRTAHRRRCWKHGLAGVRFYAEACQLVDLTTQPVDRVNSSPNADAPGYETTLVQSGYSDESRTACPTGRDRRGNAERDRGIRLHGRLALASAADAGPD